MNVIHPGPDPEITGAGRSGRLAFHLPLLLVMAAVLAFSGGCTPRPKRFVRVRVQGPGSVRMEQPAVGKENGQGKTGEASAGAKGEKPAAPLRAVEMYTRAIESGRLQGRGLAEAYMHRALAWEGAGDVHKAVEDYTRAVEEAPEMAEAYNGRGTAWDALGRYDRAGLDFRRALALNPRYAAAYANRGDMRRRRGDLDGAIDDFNRAIKLSPGVSAYHYHRGLAWGAKQDVDRALADFALAVKINPLFADAFYYLAFAWGMKGEYVLGLAEAERALKLDPDNPDYIELVRELEGRVKQGP